MSNSTIYEINKECIQRRMKKGLDLLNDYYTLIPRDVKEFKHLHIQQMDFYISQYDVKHVGNLVIMVCPESSQMQMDSFVLTPYYKNLPMFSSDYIYTKNKRCFLNELYSLGVEKELLYHLYIEQFQANCEKHSELNDMSLKACWYDTIRPICIAKNTTMEQDQEILDVFYENLRTWIMMERFTPFLDDVQYLKKWKKTKEYADDLVDRGGVSTDVFKQVIGPERTKKFYQEVFFAPTWYQMQ